MGRSRTTGSFSARGFLQLRRTDEGWQPYGVHLSMNGTSGAYRAYGWPVAEPGCPALCSEPRDAHGATIITRVRPRPDERYLMAGPRGAFTVTVDSPHWAVREVRDSGFRIVHSPQADATGLQWQGSNVEHFRSATAPAGRYGSAVFAELPCEPGVGGAALSLDGAERRDLDCLPLGGWGFAFGDRGGRWQLAGNAVGSYMFTARLVVFDFPKPR